MDPCVTILGSSLACFDSSVVIRALPALQTRFAETVVDVQWVIEAYSRFVGDARIPRPERIAVPNAGL
jgi:hypothetical protein